MSPAASELLVSLGYDLDVFAAFMKLDFQQSELLGLIAAKLDVSDVDPEDVRAILRQDITTFELLAMIVMKAGSGSSQLAAPAGIAVTPDNLDFDATFSAVTGAASYEWRLDGIGSWTNIGTSTSISGTGSAGAHVLKVRAIDGSAVAGHTGSSASFTLAAIAPPAFSVDPVTTSDGDLSAPVVGDTLHSTSGTASGSPTFAYQWRHVSDNSNATGTGAATNTYVANASDEGEACYCHVTATNAGGSATANSNASGVVAAAPVPSFDPADFAPSGGALALDMNPDDFVTADGALMSSEAASVGGVNFTAAGAARPTMRANAWQGHNALEFTAGNWIQSGAISSVGQPWTLVLMIKKAAINNDFIVLADGREQLLMMSNSNLALTSANFINASNGLLQDFYHALIYVYNGASSKVYSNGRQIATGNFGGSAITGLTIGASFDGSSALFSGRVLRACLYSGAMSAPEVVTLNDAIRTEYQLNGGFVVADSTIGGQGARIITPDHVVPGRAIIYCPGTGETHTAMDPDNISSVHTPTVLNLLADGNIVAATQAHGDTAWGNAASQADVDGLVAELVANHGLSGGQVQMKGTSKGGMLAANKTAAGITGVTIKGMTGIYPALNGDAIDAGDPTLSAALNTGYGGSWATNGTGFNPITHSSGVYTGQKFLFYQSNSDTLTPRPDHVDVFVANFGGVATISDHTSTGDHGDASNFHPDVERSFVAANWS